MIVIDPDVRETLVAELVLSGLVAAVLTLVLLVAMLKLARALGLTWREAFVAAVTEW